ncbi:hypothetical protein Tco_1053594 [Tanacetum coccineum]|uniref:Retrovirus-related Pol polyprotein from transposon TNT 1-94 n=1 Tax=Tanacetum coccineum TaxID=301880 RepID=A0ABQ5GWH4_9ASTR
MMRLKYTDGSPITDHLNAFQGIINQLAGMGIKFEDEIQGLWLLGTLPDTWETFRTSLSNSAPDGVITMELAKGSILNEETRRKSQGSSSQSDVLVTERRGRSQSRGPSNRGNHRSSSSKGKFADVEYLANEYSSWILDSGATCMLQHEKINIHLTQPGDFWCRYGGGGSASQSRAWNLASKDSTKDTTLNGLASGMNRTLVERSVFEEDQTLKDVENAGRETIPQHNNDLIDLDPIPPKHFDSQVGDDIQNDEEQGADDVDAQEQPNLDEDVHPELPVPDMPPFLPLDSLLEIIILRQTRYSAHDFESKEWSVQAELSTCISGVVSRFSCQSWKEALGRLLNGYFRYLQIAKCVALSTTEAEYMAATEACKELLWLKRFLQELGFKQQRYAVLCDNQIHTDDNASDMLTKAVAREKLKLPDIERKVLTIGILISIPGSPFS